MKDKLVRWRGEGVEYPALGGKIVQQVRFVNNEDYTALTIEFNDDTLVSFRFKTSLALLNPELSTLKDGDVVSWNKLKSRPVMRRIRRK